MDNFSVPVKLHLVSDLRMRDVDKVYQGGAYHQVHVNVNGQQECFECLKPSLRAEYTDTDDESYPPHVLVRPNKATPTRPSGKLTFLIRD